MIIQLYMENLPMILRNPIQKSWVCPWEFEWSTLTAHLSVDGMIRKSQLNLQTIHWFPQVMISNSGIAIRYTLFQNSMQSHYFLCESSGEHLHLLTNSLSNEMCRLCQSVHNHSYWIITLVLFDDPILEFQIRIAKKQDIFWLNFYSIEPANQDGEMSQFDCSFSN